MRAVDMIVKMIEDQGITQTEAARICGMSRQNLWDKLNNGNMKFRSMYRILTSFGFNLEIVPITGAGQIPDQETFIAVADRENLPYDSMEKILEAMGYRINIYQ